MVILPTSLGERLHYCAMQCLMLGYFTIITTSAIQNGLIFKILLITSRFVIGIGQGWSFVAVSVS